MLDRPKIETWMSLEDKMLRMNFENLTESVNHLKILPININQFSIFDSGQSSIVAIINPETESQFVLKTSYESDNITNEAIVLNHWRQVVSTPHIYQIHPPDEKLPVAFFTQEFITNTRLKDISPENRIGYGMSQEMGKQLALIHNLLLPVNNNLLPVIKPKNTQQKTSKLSQSLLNDNIINQAHVNQINLALEIIMADKKSSYTLCHSDFLPYNILIDNNGELVIFDPNPVITNPLSDLANTLVNTLAEVPDFGEQECVEILKGYESVSEIDYKLLNAYFTVQCIRKIDKWNIKKRDNKVQKTINFMQNHPAFLRK